MNAGLAQRQIDLIPWGNLRVEGGSAGEVPSELKKLLFGGSEASGDAYLNLMNSVVCQGSLFRSAPAVVSVIVAAITDAIIPGRNMRQTIDLLGHLLSGRSDQSEVEDGYPHIESECALEADKGYWPLLKVACTPDPYRVSDLALEVLALIDPKHSKAIVGAST